MKDNPSHLNMNNLPRYDDYLDCMVAFIDILGFDSRARNIQSEKDFYEVGRLLFTLKQIAKNIDIQDNSFRNLKVTSISDSLILTMPFLDPNPSAMTIVFILHWLQYLMLEKFETLIRGYLTRGNVYHKDNIIFGKGYSEAYLKEREIGQAPRIIIAPFLIEEAKTNILKMQCFDHILNYVLQDSYDGYYFIDYLKSVGQQALIQKEKLITARTKIDKFIQTKLIEFKDNEKILRKYKWLSNYFSSTNPYLDKNANVI